MTKMSDNKCQQFHRLCRGGKALVRLKARYLIVLLADEGFSNVQIVEPLFLGAHSVGWWKNRFIEKGIAGIEKNRSLGLTKTQVSMTVFVLSSC